MTGSMVTAVDRRRCARMDRVGSDADAGSGATLTAYALHDFDNPGLRIAISAHREDSTCSSSPTARCAATIIRHFTSSTLPVAGGRDGDYIWFDIGPSSVDLGLGAGPQGKLHVVATMNARRLLPRPGLPADGCGALRPRNAIPVRDALADLRELQRPVHLRRDARTRSDADALARELHKIVRRNDERPGVARDLNRARVRRAEFED